MSAPGVEHRVRELCLHLPGATERLSHGAPAFFAGKQFVMLWPDGHHDHGFPHLWCAAPAGARAELTGTGPERFFRPPYVGGRGWIGVRLDGDVRWDEVRPGARRPTEPFRRSGSGARWSRTIDLSIISAAL